MPQPGSQGKLDETRLLTTGFPGMPQPAGSTAHMGTVGKLSVNLAVTPTQIAGAGRGPTESPQKA